LQQAAFYASSFDRDVALRSRDDDDMSAEAWAQAEHKDEFLNFGV
jgi:hypothetical protein